jgi:hypothetical protein
VEGTTLAENCRECEALAGSAGRELEEDHAFVEVEKVSAYLLSESHPVGRLKAQFFRGLGFRWSDPQAFVAALQALARQAEFVDRIETPFGIKYVVDGTVMGPSGSAEVRTVWHATDTEGVPRMVTAYPVPR